MPTPDTHTPRPGVRRGDSTRGDYQGRSWIRTARGDRGVLRSTTGPSAGVFVWAGGGIREGELMTRRLHTSSREYLEKLIFD